jgi:hypothetical protein
LVSQIGVDVSALGANFLDLAELAGVAAIHDLDAAAEIQLLVDQAADDVEAADVGDDVEAAGDAERQAGGGEADVEVLGLPVVQAGFAFEQLDVALVVEVAADALEQEQVRVLAVLVGGEADPAVVERDLVAAAAAQLYGERAVDLAALADQGVIPGPRSGRRAAEPGCRRCPRDLAGAARQTLT